MGETTHWLSAVAHARPARWKARAVAPFVVALAFALIRPAGAASTTWNADRDDGAILLHGTALLSADVATAWRVLTDYARYGEFIQGLRHSVVRRDGTRVTVVQTLSAPCLLHVPVELTWRIVESPPEELHSLLAEDRLSVDGRYRLAAQANGVRLDYSGRMTPARSLAGLGCVPGERMMAAEFEALAAEIERQYAMAHGSQSRAGARRSSPRPS